MGSIFSSAAEDALVVAVGFGVLFVTVLQYFYFPALESNGTFNAYLVNYVFFNALHVPITFVMIYALPEFRHHAQSLSRWTTFLVLPFLFLITFFGYRSGMYTPSRVLVPDAYLFFLSKVLFLFLIAFHGLGQHLGLSILINKGWKDQSRFGPNWRERWLFRSLMAHILIYSVLVFLEHFHFWSPYFLQLKIFSAYSTVFQAVGVVANGFTFPRVFRAKKVLFLIRVLEFAFVPFSLFATLLLQANHGLEYVLISKKMLVNSELDEMQKAKTRTLIYASVATWGIICLCGYVTINWSVPVVTALLAIQTVGSMVHYWLDSVIFRMSAPENKASLGRLLGLSQNAHFSSKVT
jgi:hypothetical protein